MNWFTCRTSRQGSRPARFATLEKNALVGADRKSRTELSSFVQLFFRILVSKWSAGAMGRDRATQPQTGVNPCSSLGGADGRRHLREPPNRVAARWPAIP